MKTTARLIFLASLLVTGTVQGQGTDGMFAVCGVTVLCFESVRRHEQTGDADLDRAVAICDAHPNRLRSHPSVAYLSVQTWPSYDPNYPQCEAVYSHWEHSDIVRRLLEIEDKASVEIKAKASADREWLEHYTKTLTAPP